MLLIALFSTNIFHKVNIYNTLGANKNLQLYNSDNSGLAQLGFEANLKVGFVLGSWFFIRYIWLTKSPTDAKPRDVNCYVPKKLQKNRNLKNKI